MDLAGSSHGKHTNTRATLQQLLQSAMIRSWEGDNRGDHSYTLTMDFATTVTDADGENVYFYISKKIFWKGRTKDYIHTVTKTDASRRPTE